MPRAVGLMLAGPRLGRRAARLAQMGHLAEVNPCRLYYEPPALYHKPPALRPCVSQRASLMLATYLCSSRTLPPIALVSVAHETVVPP